MSISCKRGGACDLGFVRADRRARLNREGECSELWGGEEGADGTPKLLPSLAGSKGGSSKGGVTKEEGPTWDKMSPRFSS